MSKILDQKLSRRRLLRNTALTSVVAGATFMGPWKHNRVYAAATDKPIVIGLTHDASGQFANSGQAEKRGTIMAIDEANARGGVLGRKVEYIWADTETTPSTGSRVAERLITRNNVAFMVGAIQSGTANAISQVCQKHGTVYFNTNSSSPTESGKNCHRVKFVWDGSGANFARAAAAGAVDKYGKNWVLLTNDYVWGHNTSKATQSILEELGGSVKENILVPVGTRDYSSILLKLQQMKPDVVATAVGGDDYKALRQQVQDLKLDNKMAWLSNQLDWPDIYGAGTKSAFGVFGATWYHYLDLPGVADWVKAYKTRWPDTRINVPGNVTYNGYVAMRELLRVVEEAGTTNNIAVIKKLEGRVMKAADRMQHHDAIIDPNSHHVQQTIYLASRNYEPRDATDYFKIQNIMEPGKVAHPGEAACQLESYADTPTYEM